MPSNMPDARAVNEALRRAREMQNRSAPRHTPEPTPPPAVPEPQPAPEPHEDTPAPHSTERRGSPLDHLLQDQERTLILALLILLASEGNNTELLFALMYLLI